MKITEFCEKYKNQRFINTKQGMDEKSEWLCKELEIKTYIPFRDKKEIAEMVVDRSIEVIDGVKKYNNIDAYIGFIMASIVAHTNLECSEDPIVDYDLLAECGLLSEIVAEFQGSHNEIDILIKMAVEYELVDNQPGALIGKFLDSVLKRLDSATGALNGIIGNLDVEKMFSEENVAKIVGLLNK